MLKVGFLLILFVNFLNSFANATEFRHTGIKEKEQDYYYIGIGIFAPIINIVKDPTKFDITFSQNSEILQEINANNLEVFYENEKFSSKAIGASVILGYKTRGFLRFDIEAEFLTFSRKFKINGDAIGLGNSPTEINFTIRNTSFFANSYIDFFDKSKMTPYIGAGGGGSFVQGFFAMEADKNYLEPDSSMLSNAGLTYKFMAGFKTGSKQASFDLQIYHQVVPKTTLKTSGIAIKTTFRI